MHISEYGRQRFKRIVFLEKFYGVDSLRFIIIFRFLFRVRHFLSVRVPVYIAYYGPL